MKTKLLISLFLVLAECTVAQIGINTENPKTLLHIDGASTPATTNPISGNITPEQAIDDVTIDNLGNLGIGILAPSVKLDIYTTKQGGAIRIADGTQGINKVLMSDADGTASWASIAGSWFAALIDGQLATASTYSKRQIKNFPSSVISSATQGSVDPVSGSIKIPFSGNYRITLSAWFACYWGNTLYKAQPELFVNNNFVWAANAIGTAPNNGVYPTFIRILKLKAGDVLTVYNNETSTTYTNALNWMCFSVEYLIE